MEGGDGAREDGGERDGRCMVGTGLGREDGGERDGRRVGGDGAGEGRWRGARREVGAGLLRAKSATHEIGRLERTMEGADAAPCLERLSEAMLQSFYDRFGGLSKLTKGWTGVYMADRGGRMRTRTWLPRSLKRADASFWPANVCFSIFPRLRASFFGSAGSPCFPCSSCRP